MPFKDSDIHSYLVTLKEETRIKKDLANGEFWIISLPAKSKDLCIDKNAGSIRGRESSSWVIYLLDTGRKLNV